MQTRKDHLQAYQFAMGRLATALVSGDPGRGESPTRRGALGTFLGTGVVVLLCAGFGVYGIISPTPKDDWRNPGTIVVEQSTGTRFLYVNGELRPVRNYASALLLAGKDAQVRTVSAASLGATPHGAPVGIPDAPDTLPAPAALVGTVWTSCLRPDLAPGESVDFTPRPHSGPLPAARQALLTGPDGHRYLLWQGVLHPVPLAATLIALGLDGDQALTAPQDWLDALPTGTPLAAPALPGAGHPAGSVAGHPADVGQLFTTGAGDGHSYVMTAAGIAPVSATTAALLAARPGAAPARQVTAAELAAAPVAPTGQAPGADLPDVRGAAQLDTGGHALCLGEHVADGGHSVDATPELSDGSGTGDAAVAVPVNGGVLAVAREDVMAQITNPQQYLITDQGTVFPVDGTAAAVLGLGGVTPSELPHALLAALPHGPALTRAAAQATLGTGA